jgi:outer membrane protein
MKIYVLCRTAVVCAVATLGATASSAQDRPSHDPDTVRTVGMPNEPQDDWQIQLGVGSFYSPNFVGSKDYQLQAGPNVEVRYKDRFFVSVVDGAGFDLIKTDSFRVGPVVKFQQQRRENGKSTFMIAGKRSTALLGMGDVDGTAEAGGYIRYQSGPFSANAEVRKGIGGHDGVIAELGLRYTTPFAGMSIANRPIILSIGPGATIVDTKYEATYFSIDAGRSSRTGLARFNAKGGLQSYGINAVVVVPISTKLSAALIGGFDRLSGDAAKSPLVRERGSRNQKMVGLGLTYRFGL